MAAPRNGDQGAVEAAYYSAANGMLSMWDENGKPTGKPISWLQKTIRGGSRDDCGEKPEWLRRRAERATSTDPCTIQFRTGLGRCRVGIIETLTWPAVSRAVQQLRALMILGCPFFRAAWGNVRPSNPWAAALSHWAPFWFARVLRTASQFGPSS